jgi:hypothetical protein
VRPGARVGSPPTRGWADLPRAWRPCNDFVAPRDGMNHGSGREIEGAATLGEYEVKWRGDNSSRITSDVGSRSADDRATSGRLGPWLAMAMFVLVVDTSPMNVSISAVVQDLHTTVSGVQSAIALEALVSPISAAFILSGSTVGEG